MSQLKKGAILSYVNIGLTNIIGLILTPYIIRSLGDSEYGLYVLIGSFIGYLTILDLGLNNTIIRYVSKYRAEKDKLGEENFLALIMVIYAFISLIIVLIGTIIYFKLDQIFAGSLTQVQIIDGKKMFLILIFNLAITLPGGSFIAICNAYERFAFPRILQIVKYLMRSGLVVTILFFSPYAITLVWIDTVLNIVIVGISAYYVFKKIKVRFTFQKWNNQLVKNIFSYSIWIFLSAIVFQMQWNAGQVIVGISENTVAVAIFGVGVLLGGYYGEFARAINTLLLPQATKMSVTEDNSTAYNNAMQKFGRVNGFVLFLILGGFYLYGKSFIVLWVGESYLPAWKIAILIMIAMTLPLIQSFGNSILEAKKKNRFRSLISVFTVGLAVVTAIILVPYYKFNGVIYPFVIALIFNSFIMSWYFNKIFGFDFLLFIKATIIKPLLLIIPVVLVFYIINFYCEISGWIYLFIQFGSFTSCYILVLYFIGLNEQEKNIITRKK